MIEQIRNALINQDTRLLLREHAGRYKPGMTAEEFLSNMSLTPSGRVISLGSTAGYYFGRKVGLKSKTSQEFMLPTTSPKAVVSLLCAMAELGIHPNKIIESTVEKKIIIAGLIPSSPLHMQGNLELSIKNQSHGSNIEALTIFPGQMFAWGAGNRLITKLTNISLSVVGRLDNLEI